MYFPAVDELKKKPYVAIANTLLRGFGQWGNVAAHSMGADGNGL